MARGHARGASGGKGASVRDRRVLGGGARRHRLDGPRYRRDHRGGVPSDVPAAESKDHDPNQSGDQEQSEEDDSYPLPIADLSQFLTHTHYP